MYLFLSCYCSTLLPLFPSPVFHLWKLILQSQTNPPFYLPTFAYTGPNMLGDSSKVLLLKNKVEWLLTPVFLLGEFHGQRSLAGYSPVHGDAESDMTERISLSLQFQVQNKIVRKVQKFPMCSLPPWKHVLPHFNIQPILKLDKLISVTERKEGFRFSPNPVLLILLTMLNVRTTSTNKSVKAREVMRNLVREDNCLR